MDNMIYEIEIRGNNGQTSPDNLIWIESNLPTRAFEQWLISRDLLNRSGKAPVVRWSIVQTKRRAHFVLSKEAAAIESRIAELLNPSTVRVQKAARSVHLVPGFNVSAFSLAA